MDSVRRWFQGVVFRLRALVGRGGMERELREELDFHLEMEARKLIAAGMPAVEARREALRRFGGVDRFRERTQDAWGSRLTEELAGDVRFAIRQLVRRPAFALLALTTLALGVGATVTLFSMAQALLIRPLPFEHEDRIVTLWQPYNWTAQEYDAVRRDLELEAMDGIAAFTMDGAALRREVGSVLLTSALVTPGLFDVVGLEPALGRVFREEEHAPGATDVVILSHGVWQQELGAAPDIIGSRIELDGRPVTVVGIMPEGAFFPVPVARIWRPLELDPTSPVYDGRGWLVMMASLRADAADAAVSRDVERITRLLGERFDYRSEFDKSQNASLEPLRTHLLGDTRPALLLLLGAAGLLLLTACANVAALLVARTADRAAELALRSSIGAGRGRLARQLVTEGAVLGVIGGILGAGLAVSLHGVVAASIPVSGGLDGLLTASWTVPAGAVVLSTLLGAGLALVGLRGSLRGGGPAAASGGRAAGGSPTGQRLQWSLVAAQVTLAVTLVTGATLLIRSVEQLADVELGVRPEGVVTADLYLGSRTPAERREIFSAVTERVATMEGVDAAGTIMRLPLRERGFQGGVWIEDRPDLRGNDAIGAYYRTISPGTFEALGTRLLQGRLFTDGDRLDALHVAIVSAGFAQSAWPGEDPLGKRLAPVGFEGEVWSTVVGVVEDIRYGGAAVDPPLAVYRPVAQTTPYPGTVLVARASNLDPGPLLAAIRREAVALDPTVAVDRTSTFDQVRRASIAQPLRLRFFLGMFGALALLLGMVGVYGVVSYAVSRRTREYGVRLALGAEPTGLTRAVVRRGMAPVALGVAGGLALALAVARTLSGFLFGVAALDPVSFASAGLLLLTAGAVAALAPALRAGRVDPVRALRAE